jgi:putative transcriptional regulator
MSATEQIELSELRKRMGLSQTGLAKKLGVSRGTIGNYESGYRTPKLDDAVIIARLFNTSVENISFANKDANRRKVVE